MRPSACFTFMVACASACVTAFGVPFAAATAPACNTAGFTVTPLHGTRFYVDSSSSPVLDSGYTGFSVTPSAAKTNIWVQLSSFSGGALSLNANQPSAFPLGNLAASSTTPAYFFLSASPVAQTSTAQNFNVDVYQGDPSHGGTQLCTFGDGYSAGVYDTIQASANKVQDVTGDSVASSVSTSSPVIGGTITLTVEGTTGTLGNGPDGIPFIYETPTSLGTWPAGSFRLTGTTLTLNPGASQTVYTNQLQVSSSAWSAAQNYIAQYTFQITGTTSAATQPYPIQEISSGTQVKHTNTSSLSSIPAIQPASNTMTLSSTASPTSLPSSGGTVGYTVRLHSTSSTSTSVDEVVDTLPANATYQPGSAKLDGSAISDPTISSGTLVFPGPFTVSSAADRTLTFNVTLPATPGTYTNSVIGYVASTQLDTTTDTSDNAPATSSTSVAQSSQTITFTQPSDTRADQGPVALSATASSGLSVSFASNSASVCTVSGSSVTLVSAGTCSITASQAGNATYAAATPVTKTFQVTAAPQAQTITFAQPADTRVDQGPVVLSATASSGLTVGFASNSTSVCTVSVTSVTLLTTGTCSITASQAGNASYAAAAPVTKTFQVTAAPQAQTIAFTQPPDTRADQGPVALSATASSGLVVSFASNSTAVCTVSGSSVTLVATGTCSITASQAGNATYAAATPVTEAFQVTAAPQAQTITFTQPADTQIDQGPVSLSASASSGLAVSFASNSGSVCTLSGSSVTLVALGTCSITASQAGNGTYAAAPNVTRTFQVTGVGQTITFGQPADTRLDQGPVSLSASASSGLAVSFASDSTAVCTVSGSSVTLVATGTCSITASQAGNATYAAALPVTRTFHVTAAPQTQTITFAQPADAQLGQGAVSLTASASSGLVVSFTSNDTGVCTVSGSSVTLVAAGTCSLTASQSGNGSWLAALPVTKTFQVTAAPLAQTITFAQPADIRVDQGPVALSASASSGLVVSFTSSSASVCTVSGTSVTLVATGTCSITASQAGNASYAAAAPVTKTFQVTAAPQAQTITFAQPADTRVDQGPLSLTASASSGLLVAFASNTTAVCTVSGSSVTLVAAGSCSITASQAGNGTYAAAGDVTRTFQVTAAPQTQTITFAQPADTRVDQGPVSLSATASSGLAVSFTSNDTSICTVSGSSVALVAVGTCSITASQIGNSSYAAALPVTRTFQVTAAPAAPQAQTITFAQPADTRVDGGPVALSASASSGLPVTFASATPAVCTVSGASVTLVAAGACSITAAQIGDATYAGAPDVTRTFQVTAAPLPQTITFTQPADTRVDQGPVALSGSASSGLAVAFASNSASVCTLSGSSVTLLATGTCSITASQAGNATFAAASDVTRSFQVTAAPQAQTITFAQPADTRLDQGSDSLTANASSGLAVSFASNSTSICTVSGSSVTLVATGTCSITAAQAGNSTYAAATDVTRTFQVTAVPAAPQAQAITFAQPVDTRVDQGPVSLSASASSGLPVSLASASTAVCTVSGSSVTLLAAGTCSITASQAGDATFAAAADVSRSFQVTTVPAPPPSPGTQTIAFSQPADTRVDGGPVSLTARATSGLPVSFGSSTPATCTVSGSTVTLLATGTCTITASQTGDSTWSAAADVQRAFAVTAPPAPGTQTITFPQPADVAATDGPVSLGATASSGLPVDYASETPAVCTVAGARVTLLAAGTCTITASQAGDAAVAAAPAVARSFQVTVFTPPIAPPPPPPVAQKTQQQITFPAVPSTVAPGVPIKLVASASSSMAVSFDSDTPGVCSVDGDGLVTVLATGTCVVVVRQPGDHSWYAAPDARISIGVTLPPLPAPSTSAPTTTAGKTTQSVVGGIPAGATVTLDGSPDLPGVAALHIEGTHVVLTPAKSFSGVVHVPVVVSAAGQSVATTVTVVVRPKAPTAIAVTPQSSSSTKIAWAASASATGYVVRVDGKVVCRTQGTSCAVPAMLAPNDKVVIASTGNERTVSDDAPAVYAPNHPVLIAIVHFDTASARLRTDTKAILDAAQSKIAKGGFTHAMLTCHTDDAGSLLYNMALSHARCASVADYVRRRLGISHVSYRQAAFAYLRPAAPNTTVHGMAENRRVEVYVK